MTLDFAGRGDRGSTIPLILGVFLLALLMVGGAVAAGDAFLKQRDLQSVCDGAAAAAASAADLETDRRDGDLGTALRLGDVQGAVERYLRRDGARSEVQVEATLSDDRRTVSLVCVRRTHVAFGALFGKSGGVLQRVSSSARAPLS